VFVLKEGFTPEFLGRHFADSSGTLYDRDATTLQEEGAAPDEAAELGNLGELARVTDLNEQWSKATKLVDMEEFLSFMAIEVMLCHRDGYSLARNNYRLYHDPAGNHLVFLPHGMDQLFGRPGFPWRPSMSGTIARIAMARPETQHAYRERLENFVKNVFDVPLLSREVDRTAALIAPLLPRDEKSSFAAAIPDLKSRIARRKAFLVYELARPEPRPLAFVNGEASLTNWISVDAPVGGQMGQQNSPDGRPSLYTKAGGLTAASWRAKVLLPRGAYRFEGTVRVKAVLPLAYGNHHGARLRIGGGKGENGIVGDQTWTQVSTDFTIDAESEEVELLCELRARGGEAWFDKRSLRLLLRNHSVTKLQEALK
jgi:spore coat protein H